MRRYAEKLSRLLEYEPLATARLDRIDEALIEAYIQERRKFVAPATVNRQLATLRRLLRIAHEWRVIDRVPRMHLLAGERTREFILSHAQELLYLEVAPQLLKDFAMFNVDTGLRVGEALGLEWCDIHLEPANGAKFGYVRIQRGKSRFAKRNVPLTERVRAMLKCRKENSTSGPVFANRNGKPYLVTSIDHLHERVRATLRLPKDFVIHSFRHTYGTRLGEAGADAFTMMRLVGHWSVTVSRRYVHPTPETLERAIERLESLNQRAVACLPMPQSGVARSLTSGPNVKNLTTSHPVLTVSH